MIVELMISLSNVQQSVKMKQTENVEATKPRALRLKAITNDYLPCEKVTFIYSRIVGSLSWDFQVSYSLPTWFHFNRKEISQNECLSLAFLGLSWAQSEVEGKKHARNSRRETVTKRLESDRREKNKNCAFQVHAQKRNVKEWIKGQTIHGNSHFEKAKSICQQLFHVVSFHATDCRYQRQREQSNELKTVCKPFMMCCVGRIWIVK